jgi:hypothetical protein
VAKFEETRHKLEGNTVLKWILNRMGGCGLNLSGSDKDKWQAVVNTVMNLQVP